MLQSNKIIWKKWISTWRT